MEWFVILIGFIALLTVAGALSELITAILRWKDEHKRA